MNKLVVTLGVLVEKDVRLHLDSGEKDRGSISYACHRHGHWDC